MALPDFTTQDPATYKASIDATADDHETRLDAAEPSITDHETRLDAIENFSAVNAVRATSSQSIPNSTFTTVLFNQENHDLNAEYVTTTGDFTAKVAGYYAVSAGVVMANAYTAGDNLTMNIMRAGFVQTSAGYEAPTTATLTAHLSCQAVIYLSVGQTTSVEVVHVTGSAKNVNASDGTYFNVHSIGAT